MLGLAQTLGGTISAQVSLLAGHLVLLAVLGWRVLRDEAAARGCWIALMRVKGSSHD